MIIRTDQIENAETLKMKYNEYDLNVECIHSKKTDKQNKETLEKLENGEMDAIVTVSMMGEGLDIPEIKVAVLHVIPRTLPYTIQFLGRISRYVEQQKGRAILIADPRKVQGEVTKLYKQDKGWDKLIPNIVDERISNSRFIRKTEFINELNIDISDLKPYFSVAIKKASEAIEYNPEFRKELPFDIKVKYVDQENDDSPLVIVTESNKNIHWAYNISKSQKVLDL